MADVPIYCNLLWQSYEEAQNCPKGEIKLAFCPVCTFITNLSFEQSLLVYSERYENSLFFSPRFQEYAYSQAVKLVNRHNLYNKNIIDIGCGKGEFLLLLCELGNNFGVGFDPAYIKEEIYSKAKDRVEFIKDFYTERYMNYEADLIVCRHVLEHIHNPKSFLQNLKRTISNHPYSYIFFEVPDALHIFQNLFIWDIIYEHCSYFTLNSLSFTFLSCGFKVLELTEEYEGQFLCINAIQSNQNMLDSDHNQKVEVNKIANDISLFSNNYRSKVETCRHKLEQLEDKKQHIVIWGAGSKGVTFLNTFRNIQIDYAVDINPRKQGMYVSGTGQRIVPPEFLKNYKPNVIIIMNPIYKNEIREFTKRLGLSTKFISI